MVYRTECCSPQKIEAPVRNDDSADRSYAYGGKPIGERQNDVDRLLVDRDEPEEKRFLGTEVAFPDALRFKGAAPEIANSRYASFMICTGLIELFNGSCAIRCHALSCHQYSCNCNQIHFGSELLASSMSPFAMSAFQRFCRSVAV